MSKGITIFPYVNSHPNLSSSPFSSSPYFTSCLSSQIILPFPSSLGSFSLILPNSPTFGMAIGIGTLLGFGQRHISILTYSKIICGQRQPPNHCPDLQNLEGEGEKGLLIQIFSQSKIYWKLKIGVCIQDSSCFLSKPVHPGLILNCSS